MLRAFFIATALVAAFAAPANAQSSRVCLDDAQTREAIAEHKLANPVVAQRLAARQSGGELLRSRLCRWNEEYIYEVSLLPHDGKVEQVYVRAKDGQIAAKPRD